MNERYASFCWGYKLYDQVIFAEVVNGMPTGRKSEQFEIVYITDFPDGLNDGYVVFALGDYVKY